jgi:Ca2+-binding RTX toxin-like protein
MRKSIIMRLLTLVTIFSILATTNANTYAQEFNTGTPGDDDISSGDGNDFNVGQGGDDTIDSGDGDDTNS